MAGEVKSPRWKIWYTDFSTFSDQDGHPLDAPRTGAQLVVTRKPRSPSARTLLLPIDPDNASGSFAFGSSYYCWCGEGYWLNHDLAAMVRTYLVNERRPIVVMGEYIDDDLFKRIRLAAGNDPYTRIIAGG